MSDRLKRPFLLNPGGWPVSRVVHPGAGGRVAFDNCPEYERALLSYSDGGRCAVEYHPATGAIRL